MQKKGWILLGIGIVAFGGYLLWVNRYENKLKRGYADVKAPK